MDKEDTKKPSRLGSFEQVHSVRSKEQRTSLITYLVGITVTVVLTVMFMSFIFELNLIPNSYSTQTNHCQYPTCQGEALK